MAPPVTLDVNYAGDWFRVTLNDGEPRVLLYKRRRGSRKYFWGVVETRTDKFRAIAKAREQLARREDRECFSPMFPLVMGFDELRGEGLRP
jgi:hypothetical protein